MTSAACRCPQFDRSASLHDAFMPPRSLAFLTVVLAGLVIGVLAGRQIRFIASIPNLTAMFAWFLAAAVWGLVIIIGVIGLAIVTFRRPVGGLQTIGVAAALAGGTILGQATGAEWRYPVELGARVELELGAPISDTFSGRGICRTIENGDRIVAVQASPIVRVGTDRMSLFLWLARTEGGDHRIQFVGYHTEGRQAGYRTGSGTRLDVDTEGLQTAGSGTFTGLEAEERGKRLGGPAGPRRLDGRFSWTCDGPP